MERVEEQLRELAQSEEELEEELQEFGDLGGEIGRIGMGRGIGDSAELEVECDI